MLSLIYLFKTLNRTAHSFWCIPGVTLPFNLCCTKHWLGLWPQLGPFLPPSMGSIIQVARELSGDWQGCLHSMASSNLQLAGFLYNFIYYCLSQCVYLTALPPHKEANLPSNSKFLLLYCHIRTVIGITAFPVSEFEHLCTLLGAGRLRGKT